MHKQKCLQKEKNKYISILEKTIEKYEKNIALSWKVIARDALRFKPCFD